jgi:hypothetical protein
MGSRPSKRCKLFKLLDNTELQRISCKSREGRIRYAYPTFLDFVLADDSDYFTLFFFFLIWAAFTDSAWDRDIQFRVDLSESQVSEPAGAVGLVCGKQNTRACLTRAVTYLTFKATMTCPCRSEARVLAGWLLGSWVRVPLKAWMFVRVFLCCVVLCR